MLAARVDGQTVTRPRLNLGYGAVQCSFPKAGSSTGYSVSFGLTCPRGLVECTVAFSEHNVKDVPYIEDGSSAEYVTLNLNFTQQLGTGRLRPYLLIGVCWMDFTSYDSMNIHDVLVGDASCTGRGWNLGLGAEYALTSRVTFSIEALCRTVSMRPDFPLFQEEFEISDALSGSGMQYSAGLICRF
jgi:opacity protein-like surface antigen